MDKNNSSHTEEEKLFYLSPPERQLKSFRPQLLNEKEIADEEAGFYWSRAWPSLKENPLVPIGLTLTFSALGYGIYCFSTGRRETSHLMMRYRVGFQFLTVFAIIGGFYRRDLKRQMLLQYDSQNPEDEK